MIDDSAMQGLDLFLPTPRPGTERLPIPLQMAGYALCLVFFLAVQELRLFEPLDLRVYDLQLRILRAAHGTPLSNDVQIIGLDEGSFKAFPEPFALWHRPFARLLAALEAAHPAVVGLDVVLPDRSYEFIAPGLDRELVGALLNARKQYPLVIAQTLGEDGNARALFAPYVAAVGREGVGAAIVCNDPDGVMRQYDGSLCDGAPVATLASLMAARLGRTPGQVPGGWRGRIDFRIGPALRYTPMQDVIAAAERGDTRFLERFRGRPVLIGATLPFDDRLLLPVSIADWEQGNRRVPGVLAHAQILRSMLNFGFLQPLARAWAVVLTAVLTGAWFLAGPTRPLVYWSSFAVLALLGLYAVWLGSYLPAAGLLLSMQGAYIARTMADWLWTRRQQRIGDRQLSQRLSPGQIAGLLKRPQDAARVEVCVLACRIEPALRDLDRLPGSSAGKTALVSRLQRMAEDAMMRHQGRVDWLGDGIVMAVFAAASPQKSVHQGFEAANDLLHAAAQLREGLAGSFPGLRLAVHAGLDAGPVQQCRVGTPRHQGLRAWGPAVAGAEALAQAARDDRLDLLLGAGAARLLPQALLSRLSAHGAAPGSLRFDAMAH